MNPNYPQQHGYGITPVTSEPSEPTARRTGGVAVVAGLLGVLSAGALAWVVVEYFLTYDLGAVDMQSRLWLVAGVRAALGVLMLVLGAVTMARRITGAWLLFLFALLIAATVVLEPLVLGTDVGDWVEGLFMFEESMAVAMALAAGLGVLTAILAVIAGTSRARTYE